MSRKQADSEIDQAMDSFRSEMKDAIDEGVDDHEANMTKMGFLFLGIFASVIAIAAFLP
ncbi:hypothetical protein [Synechococcus sp. CS-197]|uniref:hypothetical protein n=1 Tax=Synechococcus sp. CS-197 TaxID=2847985 RepID=UPI00030EDFD0|nr:hypothetical protein [Synechococcus sp. CS-197]MCT0250146.1 hypothetical protein [Synechococcus sp. CS-197]